MSLLQSVTPLCPVCHDPLATHTEMKMGLVWSCPNSEAVIKLSLRDTSHGRERGEHLIQKLQNHPNIVAFITSATAPMSINNEFVAVERCSGDLSWYASHFPNRRVPPAICRSILLQLVLGFAALHAQNILHRDIKPHNLFVKSAIPSSESRGGNAVADPAEEETAAPLGTIPTALLVKIGDFGHAFRDMLNTISTRRPTSTTVGTHLYMAPEIVAGEDRSIMADAWSIGVTLFELLCGHCPFPETFASMPFVPNAEGNTQPAAQGAAAAAQQQQAIGAGFAGNLELLCQVADERRKDRYRAVLPQAIDELHAACPGPEFAGLCASIKGFLTVDASKRLRPLAVFQHEEMVQEAHRYLKLCAEMCGRGVLTPASLELVEDQVRCSTIPHNTRQYGFFHRPLTREALEPNPITLVFDPALGLWEAEGYPLVALSFTKAKDIADALTDEYEWDEDEDEDEISVDDAELRLRANPNILLVSRRQGQVARTSYYCSQASRRNELCAAIRKMVREKQFQGN